MTPCVSDQVRPGCLRPQRTMSHDNIKYKSVYHPTKWIKDLNLRLETIKPLEENIGGKLHDVVFGKYFLDMIPKA